ncbi:uncharacterized protein LOC134856947 [Symsagittifera roscoffensis]|uniref:uncharacterized protein LOC134856947 n=1 Tax=Symsagittifera roscoffensis TaxID=84072 RepID=UPI00307C4BCE
MRAPVNTNPCKMGFLDKVVFKSEYEGDKHDTTYILVIYENGKVTSWSAKTEEEVCSINLSPNTDECATTMQVERVKCFWKPTDQAFLVFRDFDSNGSGGILQIINVAKDGKINEDPVLRENFQRILKPNKFSAASSIQVIQGREPGETFLCVWGKMGNLRVFDMHNLSNEFEQKTVNQEPYSKLKQMLVSKAGELCLFQDYGICETQNKLTVMSFQIATKSKNVNDIPDRIIGIEIKLDRSSNQYEMQVCEIESSTEAKQLFQIPDTRNFLLYQQEGEKGEKHIISLWTAQFRCSYKATRNKDVKLHELMSNTKEAGPVNKVVFQSFMGDSSRQRRTLAFVVYKNGSHVSLIEYSSENDVTEFLIYRSLELFDKRDQVKLSGEVGMLPHWNCLYFLVEQNEKQPVKNYIILVKTATDKSSKDETTYQYVGVLPGADRKPLRTILDLEECGAVFMDIYERVVHYKSTEEKQS